MLALHSKNMESLKSLFRKEAINRIVIKTTRQRVIGSWPVANIFADLKREGGLLETSGDRPEKQV